jgi:TatD DNase family protein
MPACAGLVDAHAHLNSERLDAAPEALVAEAASAGVHAIVMAGVDPACWRSQVALAAAFPGRVHPVFGLHPQVIPDLDDDAVADALSELARLLAAMRPVALGETGLDRLTPATAACIARQEAAFRAQLALAARHDLPVVLHLLRADTQALDILREVGLPARGGMVHAFSGAAPFARALVDLGLHVSFAGLLANPQSRRLREAARAVPRDRLLIETDTPDQTPPAARTAPGAPRRPNRPANLPHVLAALAEARGEPVEDLAVATAENARRLFGLPPFPVATP